jgi:RHS repeat-associated protein
MIVESCLSENRVRGSEFENRTFTGTSAWLSSTARPGCGYRCDGIASVSTVQRYYASSYGRFNTADSLASSATASDPASWNRYSYTGGDPVNRNDPSGNCWYNTETGEQPMEDWDWVYGDEWTDAGWTLVPGGCFLGTDYEEMLSGCGGQGVDWSPSGYSCDEPVVSSGPTQVGPPNGDAQQLINAAYGAADRLFSPSCAGIFLAPGQGTPANIQGLAQTLEKLADQGIIRQIASSDLPANTPNNVPMMTTGTGGIIYAVTGGSFFTGTLDGKALGGVFSGMPLAAAQQLMMLHEFMHYEGIAGPDTQNQRYTLPNGDTVTGSRGITDEVFQKCF